MGHYLGVVVLVAAILLSTAAAYDEYHHGYYTDEFGVEVTGDVDGLVELAAKHGLTVERQVRSLGNVYVLKHESLERRSKRSAEDIVSVLQQDPRIRVAEQQMVLRRTKRRILHDKQWEMPIKHYRDKSIYQRYNEGSRLHTRDDVPGATGRVAEADFNDPYFPDQWYLINEGQTGGREGYDVNVLPVWQKGITGNGVVVSILDDGIDHTHPDLEANYDPEASADMNDRQDRDNDPMPNDKDSRNSHGTRCAGEVAAQANNSNCGVGIAYNAKIGGVRMLDGTVTDMLEAEALTYKNQHIHIYSSSWGPSDDAKTVEGPGPFASRALERGVNEGRGGKGSVYVWATGNGGMVEDDCSCDGYVSSIYTLSVGCISDHGLSTYFSEMCPSTMAVIYTGGAHDAPGTGHPRDNPRIKVVTTDLQGECTLEFQGTSSAAPLAAGAFALVLEANPDLTWRDVQNIVVETARIPNDQEEGWTVNGAGYHVNDRFGFGAIDCAKMVEAAQNWVTVPEQHKCEVDADNERADIVSGGTVNQTLETDGCYGDEDNRVVRLEHVQVYIELTHEKRGDLSIELVSPSGTVSEILSLRPLDDSTEGFKFTFMTVHNWGEDPRGTWTLTVTDAQTRARKSGNVRGELKTWSLILWGWGETREERGAKRGGEEHSSGGTSRVQDGTQTAHMAEQPEVKHIMAEEEALSENVIIENRSGLDDEDVEILTDLFSRTKNNNNPDQRNEDPHEKTSHHYRNKVKSYYLGKESTHGYRNAKERLHERMHDKNDDDVTDLMTYWKRILNSDDSGKVRSPTHRRTPHRKMVIEQRSLLDDALEHILPQKNDEDAAGEDQTTPAQTTTEEATTTNSMRKTLSGDVDLKDTDLDELVNILSKALEEEDDQYQRTQPKSHTKDKDFNNLLTEVDELLRMLDEGQDVLSRH